jgi:hypothetical protein
VCSSLHVPLQAFRPEVIIEDAFSDTSEDEEILGHDDSESEVFDVFEALRDHGENKLHDGPEAPTVAETLLWVFDYMAVHKTTQAQAKDVHKLLQLVLPKENSEDLRYEVGKQVVDAHLNATLVRIPVCPTGCIAYYDPVSPLLSSYRHAHRTKCHKCNDPRDYTNAQGVVHPRKVLYQTSPD